MTNVWTIVSPAFHFDHQPNHVLKSFHCSQDSETAKVLAHFLGVRLPQTYLSQKNLKKSSFLFKPVLKLQLCKTKNKVSFALLICLGQQVYTLLRSYWITQVNSEHILLRYFFQNKNKGELSILNLNWSILFYQCDLCT